MELCVVSGKGGTGKTTVSVGLAVALAELKSPDPVQLVDCDVEAPNAHLYLGCGEVREEPVAVPLPVWSRDRCTGCGACVQACLFGSLGLFGTHLEVFEEHCHACGACSFVCPEKALTEGTRPVGVLRRAETPGIELSWGLLNIGEPRAAPVIQALRATSAHKRRILDGPPGNSCSLVAAVRNADAALIVTEPTPFGVHDLELAWRVLTVLDVPSAVAVNKTSGKRGPVHAFCRNRGVPVVLEIPWDPALARAGAEGVPLPVAEPFFGPLLRDAWAACDDLAGRRKAT